jgi:hypothetical protein
LLTPAALLAVPASSSAAPEELKKLHIVMVFDNDDKVLGDSLAIDIWRMKLFVQSSFPADRHSLDKIFTGSRVTRDNILGYIKGMKVKPSEGILFFYGGHGELDRQKGHLLKLTHGKKLSRDELRQALEAKKAGLVVLLTDCCSNLSRAEPRESQVEGRGSSPVREPRKLSPTIRQLFFQARGIVDVTAATEDASWCDYEKGGIFTRSLCRLLSRDLKELDVNRRGHITWQDFFPQLQRETELSFASWSKEMRARGEERISSRTQKPFAYRLGDSSGEDVYAVVGFENAMPRPLRYEYRWSDRDPWQKVELAPEEKKLHFVKLSGSDPAVPKVQFRSPSVKKGKEQKLPSERWAGRGEPKYGQAMQYRIRAPR